jgi:uncharacterized membrane protein
LEVRVGLPTNPPPPQVFEIIFTVTMVTFFIVLIPHLIAVCGMVLPCHSFRTLSMICYECLAMCSLVGVIVVQVLFSAAHDIVEKICEKLQEVLDQLQCMECEDSPEDCGLELIRFNAKRVLETPQPTPLVVICFYSQEMYDLFCDVMKGQLSGISTLLGFCIFFAFVALIVGCCVMVRRRKSGETVVVTTTTTEVVADPEGEGYVDSEVEPEVGLTAPSYEDATSPTAPPYEEAQDL